MKENCTCGLAMRMNSAVAAAALEELRKHDNEAADRIVAMANEKAHMDWCGSAVNWLKQRRVSDWHNFGASTTKAEGR